MKLWTKALAGKTPALYSQEDGPPLLDRKVTAKFFTPDSSWTWYVLEAGDDGRGGILFFGLVDGLEPELGTFGLAELEEARGPFGLKIERDLYYGTKTFREVLKANPHLAERNSYFSWLLEEDEKLVTPTPESEAFEAAFEKDFGRSPTEEDFTDHDALVEDARVEFAWEIIELNTPDAGEKIHSLLEETLGEDHPSGLHYTGNYDEED